LPPGPPSGSTCSHTTSRLVVGHVPCWLEQRHRDHCCTRPCRRL
jgi:hypothetical protein